MQSSDLGGGGGVFVPTFMRGADSNTATSGTLITIVPPSGERVRLDILTGDVSNLLMQVKSDGDVIIAGELQKTSSSGQPSENRFSIQAIGTNDMVQSTNATGVKPSLMFKTDAVVTVVLTSGSVSAGQVAFSYSFGVLA